MHFKKPKNVALVVDVEMMSQHQSDSCHGRVSGINKICFLCSSYCRSQATAA